MRYLTVRMGDYAAMPQWIKHGVLHTIAGAQLVRTSQSVIQKVSCLRKNHTLTADAQDFIGLDDAYGLPVTIVVEFIVTHAAHKS